MGRFIIFLGVFITLAAAGMIIGWIWNKVYLSIKRKNRAFDIENEAYEKMIKKIKEDKS